MKIAVVGRGWTGKKVFDELSKRGHTVMLIPHESIRYVINSDLDWVVNCAGITGSPNVDSCEKIKKETIEANAIFPSILHNYCVVFGVKMAHFSSGCIYQGKIDDVNEDPNFFGSIYSISKGVSDSYLKDKALVFRIRMPFTGARLSPSRRSCSASPHGLRSKMPFRLLVVMRLNPNSRFPLPMK